MRPTGPMATRHERRERTHAKYKSTRVKALYFIAFLVLYLAVIWSFIQIVQIRTTNGLIPAMAAVLLLLVLLLYHHEWRKGLENRALFALIVLLLFAGLGGRGVFGEWLDAGLFGLLLVLFLVVALLLFIGLRGTGHAGKAFPLFLVIFFLALAATVTGVQGVQGVPFLLLLIIGLIVLFIAITGALVFFLGTVFWEGH